MFFADAVKALAAGEQIARASCRGEFLQVDANGSIVLRFGIGAPAHPWLPTIEALSASDWEIHVPRPGEPA